VLEQHLAVNFLRPHGVLAVSFFMTTVDLTIVNVALPTSWDAVGYSR
jgi:hypothetical protein